MVAQVILVHFVLVRIQVRQPFCKKMVICPLRVEKIEYAKEYAPIAQSVEQMTLNHWVLGSSPRGRTI